MIAVAVEQVVGRPLEILGYLFYDRLDFMVRSECEALEKLTSKSPPGRFLARPRPVYTRNPRSIVPSERVFSVQAFNYNPGV